MSGHRHQFQFTSGIKTGGVRGGFCSGVTDESSGVQMLSHVHSLPHCRHCQSSNKLLITTIYNYTNINSFIIIIAPYNYNRIVIDSIEMRNDIHFHGQNYNFRGVSNLVFFPTYSITAVES